MADAVNELLDDILDILKRRKASIAFLARELGRSYNQVYDWVKLRKVEPRAEVILELQAWRDKQYRTVRKKNVATPTET